MVGHSLGRRSLRGSMPPVGRNFMHYKYTTITVVFLELCNCFPFFFFCCCCRVVRLRRHSSSAAAEWCDCSGILLLLPPPEWCDCGGISWGCSHLVHGDIVVVCGRERRGSSVQFCEAIARGSFAAGIASRSLLSISHSHFWIGAPDSGCRQAWRSVLNCDMPRKGPWLPA